MSEPFSTIRSKFDLKFDACDPLPRVREPPPTTTKPDALNPIILPKFTARATALGSTADEMIMMSMPPFHLPSSPIEAPSCELGSVYSLDTQDVKWLETLNTQRIAQGDRLVSPSEMADVITTLEDSMHGLAQEAFPTCPSSTSSVRSIYDFWRRKRRRRVTEMHPLGYPLLEEYSRFPDAVVDLPFTLRDTSHYTRCVLVKTTAAASFIKKEEKDIHLPHTTNTQHDVLRHMVDNLDNMLSAVQKVATREKLKHKIARMDLYMLAKGREDARCGHAQSDSVSGVNDVGGMFMFSSLRVPGLGMESESGWREGP
eukprot:PhF_6_TR39052/c0_g1_i1/m.58444